MKDLIIKTTPIIISLLPVLLVLLLTKTNTIPPPKYFPALLFVKPRAFPNPHGAVRRPPPDDASLIFFGVLIFIFGPSALRVRVRPAPPPRLPVFQEPSPAPPRTPARRRRSLSPLLSDTRWACR